MKPCDFTRLRLAPQGTTLSAPATPDVLLGVGAVGLSQAVFRHSPPTPAEMERAIDITEDALMATGLPHTARGELVTSDPLLRELPGLRDEGSRLARDDIEALFQRLASVSLGNPGAMGDLPAGGQAAAALLILRECMHHLGYEGVQVEME